MITTIQSRITGGNIDELVDRSQVERVGRVFVIIDPISGGDVVQGQRSGEYVLSADTREETRFATELSQALGGGIHSDAKLPTPFYEYTEAHILADLRDGLDERGLYLAHERLDLIEAIRRARDDDGRENRENLLGSADLYREKT